MRADRFVNTIFLILALLSLLLLVLAGTGGLLSNGAITLGLLLCFWFWASRAKVTRSAVLAAAALILLHGVGGAFHLFSWQLAGVTFDTYVHLIAAFVAAMLATEYFHDASRQTEGRALLFAGVAVLLLGLGVEAVELLDGLLFRSNALAFPECARSFCHYWQDTVKDIINDALGILLFVLARTSRKELLKL